MKIFVVALAFALSGCLAPPSTSEPEHAFGGSLTEAAGDSETRELAAIVDPYGGEVAWLTSFPAQYRVTGVGKTACEEIRERFVARPYVASATACAPVARGPDPDRPTSSPPATPS